MAMVNWLALYRPHAELPISSLDPLLRFKNGFKSVAAIKII